MSQVKKECKCHKCGATLKVGDSANWVQVVKGGYGQSSGMCYNYTRWRMECLSGCNERIGQAQMAKQDLYKKQEQQMIIDTMRSVSMPEETVNQMIAFIKDHHGIIVV